jgi:hypothetical protein
MTFSSHMHPIVRHIWDIVGPLRSPLIKKMSPIRLFFLTTDEVKAFKPFTQA